MEIRYRCGITSSVLVATTQPLPIHHHAEQLHPGIAGVSPTTCIRHPERGERRRSSLTPIPCSSPYPLQFAFGPPLCGGIPPATPPSKTTPRQRRTSLLPLSTIHCSTNGVTKN